MIAGTLSRSQKYRSRGGEHLGPDTAHFAACQTSHVVSFHLPVAVCFGTQNSLSMTGTSEVQYNIMKEMYSGCEIVMGNLEITHMDHSRNFSFLRSIREVTGYILIAINQFDRLPLDQLQVIRGKNLFENRFALSVFLNYQKDGPYGLRELGFTQLTEILEGGVQILNNKFLNYVSLVNWADIVQNSSAQIDVRNNSMMGQCKDGKEWCQCDAACGGYCWGPGPNNCQILTKTLCALQCSGRCFGTSPSQCCHMECAGGCTGAQNTDCFICRQFNDSGSCVPHCQTFIYNMHIFQMEPSPNTKYQYGSICVSQCPMNFVVDGSSCVSRCPVGKMEVQKNGVKQCEPCGGMCPKVCTGTGAIDRQTVDSTNIDSFINCTKIQGSLHFLSTGINGGFSLVVMRLPSLTSLGLRSLCEINDGSVYVSDNKMLCYQHTVNWTQLFAGTRRNRRHLRRDIYVIPSALMRAAGAQGPTSASPAGTTAEEGPVSPSATSTLGSQGNLQGPTRSAWPATRNVFSKKEGPAALDRLPTTGIVLGIVAGLLVCFLLFVLTMLYQRGLAIRRKRVMRRYLESGESFEPLDPGEKGAKVHARTLKPQELRKIKVLGSGVFGTVHKGVWIPEGDSVKIPVAIKTIQDRTGRQTFTELTDMESSLADAAPDESHQRRAQLGDLEAGPEDQEEGLDGCLATPPLYLSPSRSHSRRRVDSHRSVRSHTSAAGYLPMTPGPGEHPQQLWVSSSRHNSTRVSAGCSSSAQDEDLRLDTLSNGGLCSARYHGVRACGSAHPTSSPAPLPTEEEEEDYYGYMLPSELGSTCEDVFLEHSTSQNGMPSQRDPRVSRSPLYPPGPDTDSSKDYYEDMNKQSCQQSLSSKCSPNQLADRSLELKFSSGPTAALVSPTSNTSSSPGWRENTAGLQQVTPGQSPAKSPGASVRPQPSDTWSSNKEDKDGQEETAQSPDGDGDSREDGQPKQALNEEEYHYSDSQTAEVDVTNGSTVWKKRDAVMEVASDPDKAGKNTEEEKGNELSGEECYQYNNSHPKLSQTLIASSGLRILDSQVEEGEENQYEVMDSIGVVALGAEDRAQYQNIKDINGMRAEAGLGKHNGLGAYVKVCAGVGEPRADRSFDNPDYWHSRLFLKPDAVRT
ncbi:receptor tyrosine-protein kinase erbB-3-like [Scleropages formosus]|uniref:receptor protein-tyrosine kinase n=1 Tax=Scleropages formosus TaxID=113540 RepID=A0A0P7VG12_SCLFO|nr:receptor tyrosine-protein kinase erbB-3-like [Scleropages formosus]